MPRPARLVLGGQAHHIIQRGNNRQPVFFTDADRRFFLEWLGKGLAAEGCALHAYVLMTNHVHLMITPATDDGVSLLMQSLGRSYVAHINRAHGRTGTLWEGRFKSTILDTETYLMACHRYIEANPVRAGMVAHPRDHPWSSWRHYGEGRADPLIVEHEVFRGLAETAGQRRAAYQALFAAGLPDDVVATLRDATQRGWVAGREPFRETIEAALGRRVGAPVRGRPRKANDASAAAPGETGVRRGNKTL